MRLTYGEVLQNTRNIASELHVSGVSDIGKVAVLSANDARAFIAMLAIFRAGRVYVPLNARNTVEDNIAFLKYTDVEFLFYHSAFENEVRRIQSEVPGVKAVVCLDRQGSACVSLAAFGGNGDHNCPDIPEDRLRPCNIFPTGGTTGRSKGAVWTNLTWEAMIATCWTSMPSRSPPVHLCTAPMTHGAGCLALMLLPGAPTNVILNKADPVMILDAIGQHGVTHIFMPPTVLYAILASSELRTADTSSLEYFLIAAAPVSADKLREAVAAFGPVMCQAFGQSEAPLFLTFLSREDHERAVEKAGATELLQSCGRPTMFSRVEIMGEDGEILPSRDVGEIVVRGNHVMLEYYKDPVATEAVSTFGWHHTGDIGFKDENDYVYIVDRKRDIIISGGFNVFSTEVEQALLSHPAVQDCAVIGVPDEKWGESVKAVVELKAGMSVTAGEIIAHCRPRLGGVKTPKTVEIWSTLPRSPVGKVLKREIRDKYWAGRTRAI
jgi:acyl-CoA synthetase (AMP-forming)/AMP-acid ligase II